MTTFEAGYRELFRAAYGVAYRILVDVDAAADAAQEISVRAYQRWDTIEPYATAWACRAAGNLAIDMLRRQSRRAEYRADPVHHNDSEQALELIEEVRRLPKRQRETIFLRYYADMSERQIAEVLGCKMGTVKTHIFRGTHALERRMKELRDESATS